MVAMPIIDYQDTAVEVHRLVVAPSTTTSTSSGAGDRRLPPDRRGQRARPLLELCRSLGVRQVVETHGHWDHIQAVEAVRDAGIDVAVTSADAGMLPSYDQLLEDRSVLEIGRLRIATVATPGHTPGSMCFSVEGTPLLFSGDTLFPGGREHVVRPLRLPDHHPLHRGRLFSEFGADTLVLPGHGAGTTIGAESPHLAEWIDRGLVSPPGVPTGSSRSDGGRRPPGLADQLDPSGQPADRHAARDLGANLDGHPGPGQGDAGHLEVGDPLGKVRQSHVLP